jgi:Domain of unknown function (DUF4132)
MSDPHPETLKLLERMTGPPPSHPRFAGELIDLSNIDALALGDLWQTARAIKKWDRGPVQTLAADTARAVLDLRKKMEPAFRGSVCRDHLDRIARSIEEEPKEEKKLEASLDSSARHDLQEACFALARCVDLSFDGLGPAAKRLLAVTRWHAMPQISVALARLVDAECTAQVLDRLAVKFASSPLLVDELRTVATLDLPANIAVADVAHPRINLDEAPTVETRHPLSDIPGYVAFAETGLKEAAARLHTIHAFESPYASDKAFTLDESAVLARLARVALDRDEAWLPPVLDELFRKVSLAPTAAKTVPSQSVAIALGHAVEAFPTPEAVATLRIVLRHIRHAGVEKKLQRNVRGAERGLAGRPEVALRLSRDQSLSKAQLTTLTRCLEAGLALRMVLNYDDWRARLATHTQAKNLTGSLVWRMFDATGSSVTALPVMTRDGLQLRDVTGAGVAAPSECRVMLWHPTDATATERDAWRDRLAQLQIKQPFKQIFREHYVVPSDELSDRKTAIFSGHTVSIPPFLGLARQERWRLGYDFLIRSFGQWFAKLDLADPVYPGSGGATNVKNLSLWKSGGRKSAPARLDELPAATLSEILRAVDLLVSVSGFALTTEDADQERENRLQHLALRPLGPMAEMRKQALERALRGLDGMADLHFDARHLRLGPYAIHLATGRVTRQGEPVTIDVPKRSNLLAVPWLPYDEKLLETICCAAIEIARRIEG